MDQKKIKEVLEKSREVLLSCCLKNGAIVAADSDSIDYPKESYYYRYVWPRDASYICVALDILGEKDAQKRFFRWVMERAEDTASGLLFQNYYPNGLKRWLAFQPDQNGSVLWAIHHHFRHDLSKASEFRSMIKLLADGICNHWQKDHFTNITQDLWEERFTFPDLCDTHTYSLAACSHGLRCADEIVPDKRYLEVRDEMIRKIESSYSESCGYFLRTHGKISDKVIDASMIGLVFPFEIFSCDDPRVKQTISKIKENLSSGCGLYRYEHDFYDGWRFQGMDRKKGGGVWPILSLWMSIIHSSEGEKEDASKYFQWVMDNSSKNNIPEQVFDNDLQVSVCPLAWSHAMMVIAAERLGMVLK